MRVERTTTPTERPEPTPCYLHNPADIPTGRGRDGRVFSLRKIRKDLGLPVRYRAVTARLTDYRIGESFPQGPPPRLVPASMRKLHTYMALRGDTETKATNAGAYLMIVHPWDDGNGRTARELYRRYTGDRSLGDCLLRNKMVSRLKEWGGDVFPHLPKVYA